MEDDHDANHLDAGANEFDFEIGRIAADAVMEEQFADYEFAFCDENDPQFVYQDGEAFVVIETEVLDGTEDEDTSYGKTYRDGLVYERGTRQYLETSIEEWLSSDRTRHVAKLLSQALMSGRVEYILVTSTVSDTEVSSIDYVTFEL